MPPAIRVENLSKLYRLGNTHSGSIRELVNGAASGLFGRRKEALPHEAAKTKQASNGDFWALKDVSFEVQPGEVVGIIGKNGAGKSTLLKILSRITSPTSGRVQLHGRVASLLEVGTGFHPELTGRENVYLNGAILGMTKAEVRRKFDEIVAFAEIDQFIDTPVKRYSSGMYVRLAFAVAAHLEPEILIVDEVLAVGDYEFQQKCLGKMREVASGGKTVLFVSHNMAAIQRLTEKGLLLLHGCVEFFGSTANALEHFLNRRRSGSSTIYNVEGIPRNYPDLQLDLEILRLQLLNQPCSVLPSDDPLEVELTLRASRSVNTFRISTAIYQQDQEVVGNTFSGLLPAPKVGQVAKFLLRFDRLRLSEGKYYCALSVGCERSRSGFEVFDVVSDVLHFEVLPPLKYYGFINKWQQGWGPIRLESPTVTPLDATDPCTVI